MDFCFPGGCKLSGSHDFTINWIRDNYAVGTISGNSIRRPLRCSPHLCKRVIGETSSVLLACFISRFFFLNNCCFSREGILSGKLQRISPESRLKLLGAVKAQGMIDTPALSYGIKYGCGTQVIQGLNMETVATTLLAWLIFKEYIGTG